MPIADTLTNIGQMVSDVTSQVGSGATPDSTLTELSPEEIKRRKVIRTIVFLIIGGIIIALVMRSVKKK